MKFLNYKTIISTALAATLLTGCASTTGNQDINNNQRAIIGTVIGAVAGGAIGNKSDNKVLGAVIGGAIGGYIGYRMDQQAKEVADSLNTTVNNDPNAVLDPSQDLIVSHTDNYVKIMFRDAMMFQTNSAMPTPSASAKIAKVGAVLQKYPNTLVQVVGHTDSRGTYAYNKTLSDKRASNVGNTIHGSGVKNQIFSKGCSFDKPVAPNTNATNMALNRRVEIYLYPNQQSVIDVCK